MRDDAAMSADPELFVAVSVFVVANEMDDAVQDAFRARPHLVDGADGFVRLTMEELLAEKLVSIVGWEVQLEKAGVRHWETA